MLFHEALGEVIRTERLAQKLTLRDLSKTGFVALGHLSEVERGTKCPSSQIIEAIANGLGKSSYELIIEAGFRMATATIPETPEKIYERTNSWFEQYSDLAR